MEKKGNEARFGIMPNCNHCYCLECLRKWRKAKQFEHKIVRYFAKILELTGLGSGIYPDLLVSELVPSAA